MILYIDCKLTKLSMLSHIPMILQIIFISMYVRYCTCFVVDYFCPNHQIFIEIYTVACTHVPVLSHPIHPSHVT